MSTFTNTTTEASKAIKAELSKAFAGIKFSVRKENYSTIRVDWVDGPTLTEVENVTDKYEYGSFDGMTDSYSNTNVREDLPQVKYVMTARSMSAVTRATLEPIATPLFEANPFDCHYVENWLYRIFAQTSFKAGDVAKGIVSTGAETGLNTPAEFYKIV